MSTVIVWFRTDLRLADNPALHAALDEGHRVVPAYIHAPEEAGDWAPGAASRWWLHHSLTALDGRLRERGSRLVLRRGPSLRGLQALLEETGAEGIYWNRRYEPAQLETDRAVKRALTNQGVRCRSFNAALLFEPWTIATGAGSPYRVFTPFWRRCQQHGLDLGLYPAPERVPGVSRTLVSLPLAELALLPSVAWDDGLRAAWQPGEAGAQARLTAFCAQHLSDYGMARDRPEPASTSRLSPHLHFGELGPRQVVWALRHGDYAQAATEQAAEAVLRELGWREFAYHILHHFPRSCLEPLDARFARFPWRRNARLLRAWQQGRTGYPIIDAGLRELWRTGWMHNRVRMIVASFLTKNCRIHWLEGARWFWDTLVDADLAANSLNWQWVAGSGADAAPYFRIFNPLLQAKKFDPHGEYVRRWVPELAALPDRWLHVPWEAPPPVLQQAGVRLGRDYPRPLLDLAQTRDEALAAYRQLSAG